MKKLLFSLMFLHSFSLYATVLPCDHLLYSLVLSAPREHITEKLTQSLSKDVAVISAAQTKQLTQKLGISENQLMIELIPLAKKMAQPHISNYFVGAVGKGLSGALYLGRNIEFPNADVNNTIHGEHSVIASALLAGEKGLEKIAISAAPCGFCRQLISEVDNSEKIKIIMPGFAPKIFTEVLPGAFGPKDLGLRAGLLKAEPIEISPQGNYYYPLNKAAFDAAKKSYSPYTHSAAGIALRLKDGRIIEGMHFENAGFQKISALNVALVNMVNQGIVDFNEIVVATLAEEVSDKKKGSEIETTRSLLKAIAPNAEFVVLKFTRE